MRKMHEKDEVKQNAAANMAGDAAMDAAPQDGAGMVTEEDNSEADTVNDGMEAAAYAAMNLGSQDNADETLRSRVADLTQDLQRTRADFENFRKQTEVQKAAAEKSARLKTVFKMLPLLDDMGRAIASYEELKPLAKSLEKTLGELELKLIEADAGTEFNPDLHDAVAVEGEGGKEVIGEVLRPGYYYQGEVLRPAMVKVVKQ